MEGAAKSLHLPRRHALQATPAGVSVEGDFAFGEGVMCPQSVKSVKILLILLLFAWFYLSMSTVICIFAAISEYGLYRDNSTGYNP